MQYCKFCGAGLLEQVRFCGHCGQTQLAQVERPTSLSDMPTGHLRTLDASTMLRRPSHTIALSEVQGNQALAIRHRLPEQSDALFSPHSQEHQIEEQRTLPLHLLLPAILVEVDQASVGNVPMVQGTPQISGAPMVQGSPNAAASASPPLVPSRTPTLHTLPPEPAPSVSPNPAGNVAPHSLPTHQPLHLLPHHHLPHRKRTAHHRHHRALKWGGVGIGAVVVVTSIIVALLFLIPPALSLSGDATVTSRGMLHLHGSSFTPGNSVSLTLDNGLPLSSAVHSATGEARYNGGPTSATAMQVLVAGQFIQSSGTDRIVHVGFNGAFDVTIVVNPSWSVGPHTIYATEQFTSRKAALKFTIVPTPANLVVNSSPLDFGKLQQGNKVVLSAVLKNSGGAPLAWTADTGGAAWLMLQASTGTIQPDEQQLIDVTADTSHLKVGVYSATLHIISNGGEARLGVKVQVVAPGGKKQAILHVNPSSLNFGQLAAGKQASQLISVGNMGTLSLGWKADPASPSWLRWDTSSGTIQAGGLPETINVSVDTTKLAVGNYSANLTISSNGGNISLGINLVVIALSPTPTPSPTTIPSPTTTPSPTPPPSPTTTPSPTPTPSPPIYVSSNTSVYALNTSSGAQIWSYQTGSYVRSLMVSNNVVYLSSITSVYALSASSGAQLWSYQAGNYVTSLILSNGIVYVSADNSGSGSVLYALNASSGALLWSYQKGGTYLSSLTVSNGTVYINAGSSTSGFVYALNASSGTQLWSYQVDLKGGAYVSSLIVSNGMVYISVGNSGSGSVGSVLYALNASSGALLWSYKTGGTYLSSPAVSNGTVYISASDPSGAQNSFVYALNASGGTLLWSYQTVGTTVSSLTASNGTVYISANNSSTASVMYALNASSGAQLWSYQMGYIFAAPTVSNGVVYIGADNSGFMSVVYALNASSGALLWSNQVDQTGGTYVSSLIISNGTVYASTCGAYVYVSNAIIPFSGGGCGNNYVYALNANMGSLIWYYHFGS